MKAIFPPPCLDVTRPATAAARRPRAVILAGRSCALVCLRQAVLAAAVLACTGASPMLVDDASAHSQPVSKDHTPGRACDSSPEAHQIGNEVTDHDRGPYLIAPIDADQGRGSAVDQGGPDLLAQRLRSMREMLKATRGVDLMRLGGRSALTEPGTGGEPAWRDTAERGNVDLNLPRDAGARQQ